MKEIVYGKKAKDRLFAGIEKLAKVVIPTLGPKGKNVALKDEFSDAIIVNDGVTIAKEVELEDPVENLGANLIKEAALKTNDLAGDGTTTATVLAYSMVKDGLQKIESGANEVIIRSGMNKALDISIECLKKMSQELESGEQIRLVANLSSGSEEVGKLIYDALNMIGNDGIITTEESKTSDTKLEIVEGLKIDSGYISSYLVDENISAQDLENPYILVTNKKISNFQEILPIAQKVSESGRSLVLIVQDIDGEALATLIINKMRGTLNSIAIKAPSFGQNRKDILEDVAISVGSDFIDEESPVDLRELSLENLGTAKSVKITKDSTIILNGSAKIDVLDSKIESIKRQILQTGVSTEIQLLRKRLARLLGAVAVIQVGAQTQTELNEKKLRVEDALCATRAAIEEGIVIGGGCAYIGIANMLEDYINSLDDEEKIGAKIVQKALEKPLYYIAQNSGVSGELIVQKIKEKNNYFYDANSNSIVNYDDEQIIDPTKVERVALESAVSIASMILTTDGVICKKETRES